MTCMTVEEAIAEAREYANTSDMSEACFARLDAARTLADEVERLLAIVKGQHNRPKIVCLCGSTRFTDAFYEAGWQLTLDGHIVLSIGVCKHAEHHGAEAMGQDVADRLDELHLRKIDLADWVLILNVGGYVGESTAKEIEYARQQGKQVTFLEPQAAEGAKGEDSDSTE